MLLSGCASFFDILDIIVPDDGPETKTVYVDGVDINSVGAGGSGGQDGDINTIQNFLPDEAEFSVDSFAITLWEDTFGVTGISTVQADVRFDSFEVFVDVPEPASGMILVIAAGIIAGRQRWLVYRIG